MQLARIINKKKFMWDGKDYPDKKSALDVAQKYKKDRFETEVFEEKQKFYVFTRRVVEEVVVEGQPTI
ncbi:hypothetical protein ES703_13882 [subsurface metagenome]|uniref:Uncharacterized protein n=1 Tax=marine sediment metagenome TaxID=412755 RepID=X1BCB9_9ZZZZ